MKFQVQNKISGFQFGAFAAASEQEAIIACLTDSGTEWRHGDQCIEVYVGDEWEPCELTAIAI
jgi:hypothetical protein